MYVGGTPCVREKRFLWINEHSRRINKLLRAQRRRQTTTREESVNMKNIVDGQGKGKAKSIRQHRAYIQLLFCRWKWDINSINKNPRTLKTFFTFFLLPFAFLSVSPMMIVFDFGDSKSKCSGTVDGVASPPRLTYWLINERKKRGETTFIFRELKNTKI